MSKFMKILHVGAELFHGDGRTDTDMAKLVIGIRNSAKAPKNELKKINVYFNKLVSVSYSTFIMQEDSGSGPCAKWASRFVSEE
jgi:hypothetical protein